MGAPGDRDRVGALELVDACEHPLHVPGRRLTLHEEAGLQVHPVDEPAQHLHVERLREVAALRVAEVAVPLALELEDALDLLGNLGLCLSARLRLRCGCALFGIGAAWG